MKPIKPMLLTEYFVKKDLINSQKFVYIQPKLDGWRSIANTSTGEIFSRTGKLLNLPHISKDLLELNNKNIPEWIDGELYKHGETLGKIQSMIRKSDSKIKFNLFDYVDKKSFSSRFFYNYKIETENIKPVKTEKIRPHKIMRAYRDLLNNGYEGAVIRIDGKNYDHYRSDQVIKLKPETEFA